MPAPNPFESPNRLRLGQGIPGGVGSLPPLHPPVVPTAPPPPRIPLRPHPNLGVPAGYALPSPAGTPRQSLPARGAAILRRGDFGAMITEELKGGPFNRDQVKAINLLHDHPDKLLKPKNSNSLRLVTSQAPGSA